MTCPVTVIMPALNEQENIAKAVDNVAEAFSRLGTSGEIVVVNDGSTDGTAQTVHGLMKKYPFVRLLEHSSPRGIGASFMDGVRAAEGEIVTMLPGDGENDAFEILRYAPLMKDVDIVVPFIYNRQIRSAARRVISRLYRAAINLLFGTSLNYTNGTVMYKKCVLEGVQLKADGFFYQTELLIKCIRRGYLYAEVPCRLDVRGRGRSRAIGLESLREVLCGCLRLIEDVYFRGGEEEGFAPGSVTAARKGRP